MTTAITLTTVAAAAAVKMRTTTSTTMMPTMTITTTEAQNSLAKVCLVLPIISVIYDERITDAFFKTVEKLVAMTTVKSILIALEQR